MKINKLTVLTLKCYNKRKYNISVMNSSNVVLEINSNFSFLPQTQSWSISVFHLPVFLNLVQY